MNISSFCRQVGSPSNHHSLSPTLRPCSNHSPPRPQRIQFTPNASEVFTADEVFSFLEKPHYSAVDTNHHASSNYLIVAGKSCSRLRLVLIRR